MYLSLLATTFAYSMQSQAEPKPEPQAPDHPRQAQGISVMPDFTVELLHKTNKPAEGSWVAICAGPEGTLFVSAQYAQEGRGESAKKRPSLFQIKPPAVDDHNAKTQVIPQPVELNGAQGLCYAFGNLYAMESGRSNGLSILFDANGDGLYDSKKLLLNIKGAGEHGTHAIVPAADGKGLYLIAGNMTPLPDIQKSRPVKGLWGEDHALPQNPDGRGHASGLLAPGGWIIRVNPDGSDATLICTGFRNPYDIAVHPNGEIFTFDADMEWDLGQPWYRPTRINHATSGAEFGWRNGSGKWPAYYEDSLGSVVDLGPGSPAGITFGTGAAFPTQYQQALYALDWTFGTIYAIDLNEQGSSYTASVKPFVMGKPLPVTDVAIAADGHMYFTTGGRRGDSALYRVSYHGTNDKAPPTIKPLNALALLRKSLEALHHPDAGNDALGLIWANLGHDDRAIRFAARVALEHQPADRYIEKALAEADPLTRVSAGLALARHRHIDALTVLTETNLHDEDETTLAWQRALAVALARGALPTDTQRTKILGELLNLADNDNQDIKTEVVRLRVALNDPGVIEYTIGLMNTATNTTPPDWLKIAAQNDRYGAAIKAMRDNPPPSYQLGLAFMLRNMTEGWNTATRQAYFGWLNQAALSGGGNSYQPALKKIREQAVATLTDQEKLELGPLIDHPTFKPKYNTVQPVGPGRKWNVKIATKLVERRLSKNGRNFERGAGLYQAALCSQCHVMNDYGGDIGPQLTSAAGKFGVEDLLRATIEPSHEVNDQYAFSTVTTKDGKTHIGRIIERSDAGIKLQPNPQVDTLITLAAENIESIKNTQASPMPAGLVDGMNVEELTDLVAYILSKDDRDSTYFKK